MKNWLLAGLLLVVAASLSEAQDSQATVGIPINHQLTTGFVARTCEDLQERSVDKLISALTVERLLSIP